MASNQVNFSFKDGHDDMERWALRADQMSEKDDAKKEVHKALVADTMASLRKVTMPVYAYALPRSLAPPSIRPGR